MAQSEGTMFIDGQFYPASEGKIPVLDAGFWMGINIFDTLSARQGYIFKSGHTSTGSTARHSRPLPFYVRLQKLQPLVRNGEEGARRNFKCLLEEGCA